MNVTEKRRSFLINVMYFTVLIGLFFLFFKYAFGICLPLLTALFVAAVLQKPVDYLTKKQMADVVFFLRCLLYSALWCSVRFLRLLL